MKKTILSITLAALVSPAFSQVYMPVGPVHHHGSRGSDVAGAILLGSIIGYGVSQASRRDDAQVIIQPRVVALPRAPEPVYDRRLMIDQNCNCPVEVWTQVGWR